MADVEPAALAAFGALAALEVAALMAPAVVAASTATTAVAMVASCALLGWTVLDGLDVVTGLGRGLNLAVDPLAVVKA